MGHEELEGDRLAFRMLRGGSNWAFGRPVANVLEVFWEARYIIVYGR